MLYIIGYFYDIEETKKSNNLSHHRFSISYKLVSPLILINKAFILINVFFLLFVEKIAKCLVTRRTLLVI